MITWLTLFISLILLLLLLVYEKREEKNPRLITKAILSGMFVWVAFQQSSSLPDYSFYIIGGLALCFIGDVCLAWPGEKAFRAGLVAFLLGHIFYSIAFSRLIGLSGWISPAAILFWLFSLFAFLWLRPHLKAMLVPVGIYILVITSMVTGAWAVFTGTSLSFGGRCFVLAGAFLFYLSDLFVARNQFVKPDFINRFIGLPLYYLGQFFLAFSIGLF
jgi:uncharacterized membrane protein YhhN